MTEVTIAISTCPNDTFTFHGLLSGAITIPGIHLNFQLLDIEELNQGLRQQRFDVAKASFHLALHVDQVYRVLPVGAALGFGVGPLLLASRPGTSPVAQARDSRLTLTPGADTTAHLLLQLFYPNSTRIEHCLFSRIMPELQAGRADFGVCIHEGRFTWESQGLYCVTDLGTVWEQATNSPLPLGGLLAHRNLSGSVQAAIVDGIRRSLALAHDRPDAALLSMRRYAQELDDRVLMQHVELYVNEWTMELGPTGRQALRTLARAAHSAGVISTDAPEPFADL